ncbi:MAG TPA: zf-HC2 domain-containing protein [Syntrophorhabdaceae bacterium]|nr:zf-HC2 domain-containing protein [Syntrophorhabdaceae bacterium]
MMSCEQYSDLIMLHFDGNISEDQKKSMEKHLTACQQCRELFLQLDYVLDELKEPVPPEPGREIEEMVMSRIMSLNDPKDNRYPGFTSMMGILFMAATAPLLFLLGAVVQGMGIAEFTLWGRNMAESLSDILIDFQVVYHILTGVFQSELFSVVNGLHIILTATAFFTAVLVLKSVFGEKQKNVGVS